MAATPVTDETADQRIVMYGVPWHHFEGQLTLRADLPVPRVSYLEGALELMSPSQDHERIKSYLSHLVVTFAIEQGIELSAYGSWTLKSAAREAGAEPDECYIVGTDQAKSVPDLVLEVIWTSGGLDKLAIYARLGVPEVWCWTGGRLDVYVLDGDSYGRATHSALLPGLDLDLLVSFLDRPTVTQAIRAYRNVLRKGSPDGPGGE
jgi:Uma2 family endonuclease